jgi:hypothetical protein
MPVKRVFRAQTELNAIPAIGDSLGTHLAAKLQAFGSDERTLTDELCDMLCVWAELLPTVRATGALGRRGRARRASRAASARTRAFAD